MSATIHHLPPRGSVHLPAELRAAVTELARRQPGRRAVLERQAARWLVEFGELVALQRLAQG